MKARSLTGIGIAAIVVLGLVVITKRPMPALEPFGTSPGTMTQLATSHVPTEEDARFYRQVYPGMVRREITELTGGDPGVVRPWIFPWYGRGVTLVATG